MRSKRGIPALVLGDGGWGTALAMVLRGNDLDVRVLCHDPEYARLIDTTRRNPKFLPDVEIPDGIRFGHDVAELSDGVDAVFSVVPTQFLRGVLARVRDAIP